MAGYVYRGTIHDVEPPEGPGATPGTERQQRPRALCGTPSGYHRHVLDHTPTCPDCKQAWANYMSAFRASKGRPQTVRRDPPKRTHGTNGGYQQHLRRGERPCPECCGAHRDYLNAYNAARRNLERCRGCHRPIARTRGPRPAGTIRHQACGLCPACYKHERKHL